MQSFPGACTWSQAREAGMTRRQIETDGVRLGRGLYLSRGELDDLPTRCRAWARLLPDGAASGLQTAAALLGAFVDPPDVVQAVVGPDRWVPHRSGLTVLHRELRPEDVVEVAGLPVTSGAQTFLHLARCTRPDELVAIGEALYRLGHLDTDRLQARLDRADGLRGVVRARACAPRLTPLAMSRPESLVRCWILDSPLPDPEPQMPVVERLDSPSPAVSRPVLMGFLPGGHARSARRMSTSP